MKHKEKNILSANVSAPTLKRYAYIDSLRGLAIIAVLIAHTGFYGTTAYPSWFHNLTEISVGPRGVQLFYVISAVTLCFSYSKRKNIEKHPIRNFYIRRFFRIAPLFYLAVLFYLWQWGFWNHNPNHISSLNILTTLTFVNGFFPRWINNIVLGSWSVAIETTFYLFFPILFLLYERKPIRFALLFTVLAAIAMQCIRLTLLTLPIIKNSPDLQTYTFQFFPSQFPVFLIGMFVFLYMHSKNHSKKFTIITVVLFGTLLAIQMILPIKILAGHYLYSIFFGFLVYFLSKYPMKLLVNPLLTYLGKISFSLYLCHVACYSYVHTLGIDTYIHATNPYVEFSLRFLMLLGFSTIIASILYLVVEKPGIILGKKIISKHERITPAYVQSNIRTW